MTTPFYAPPQSFAGGTVHLPQDEARHAVKVLRHGPGDEILVVDGAGGRHTVRLERVDRDGVSGKVLATEHDVGEPPYALTIGLGMLKNASRFETFVEKAVELGVTRIIPLVTERTERPRLKEARLQNIMIAAMKQSGRCRLPQVDEPTHFPEAVRSLEGDLRLLCHERAAGEQAPDEVLRGATAGSVAVLVGPEGGCTDDEVELALQSGWRVVSLGPRRLRAETAAIVAATAVMLALERQGRTGAS